MSEGIGRRCGLRLERDGYLFLRGLLDPAEVMAFRRYYFERTGVADAHGVPRVVDPGELRKRAVRRGGAGRGVRGVLRAAGLAVLVRVVPGRGDVPASAQDHPAHRTGRERGSVRRRRRTTTSSTCAKARTRCCPRGSRSATVRSPCGGLTYLEGSHHRVLREEAAGTLKRPAASITADLPGLAEEYDARWLVADYAAGDVVIHTAHIVHASLDNVASSMRLSTDIRYQLAATSIDARWQSHWHDQDGL